MFCFPSFLLCTVRVPNLSSTRPILETEMCNFDRMVDCGAVYTVYVSSVVFPVDPKVLLDQSSHSSGFGCRGQRPHYPPEQLLVQVRALCFS